MPLRAPPLPQKTPPINVDKLLSSAMTGAQHALDLAIAWPRWTAFALLSFAIALTLLGRQGQRLLAGTCFAALVVGFALLFLRPQAPGEDWPGLVAVIGGGAAFALGIGLPGWTTALLSAVTLGALGGLGAIHLVGAPWLAGALPLAILGLFLGLANHLFWGLWIPPIAAAFSFTLAIAKLSAMEALTHADIALATAAVLAVALLAISLERDHLRKKRVANKTKQKGDQELKARMERDRERHAKYLGNKKS
jgi:hypothetical protein